MWIVGAVAVALGLVAAVSSVTNALSRRSERRAAAGIEPKAHPRWSAVGKGATGAIGGLIVLAGIAAVGWVLWYVTGGWMPSEAELARETQCQQQANDAGIPRGQRWLDFVDRCTDEGP